MAKIRRLRVSILASSDERNTESNSRKDLKVSLPVLLGHRQAWKEITAIPRLHTKNTQVKTAEEGSMDCSDDLRSYKGDTIHRRDCAWGL